MSRLENAKEEFDSVPFSRLKSRFWTNDMMYTYPFAHPSQQTKTGETKPNPIFPSSNGHSVAWKVPQFDHFPTDLNLQSTGDFTVSHVIHVLRTL